MIAVVDDDSGLTVTVTPDVAEQPYVDSDTVTVYAVVDDTAALGL